MRYRVTTLLREGIRDNAGVASTLALHRLGFPDVTSVLIGNTYEFDYEGDVDEIVKELYNPVMEDYTVEVIEE